RACVDRGTADGSFGSKCEELTLSTTSPVCLRKRTPTHPLLMSQKCQFQTHPPQQAALFDQLVGAGDELGRNVEANRLCGFEVDDQIELRRKLHRQLAHLGAA